ncbi:MAG: DsrE family protein [Candidatus Omnitrophota bacterium]|nr:MAG: DsrE family protein [Candidatus Omnitrophota bacterium]
MSTQNQLQNTSLFLFSLFCAVGLTAVIVKSGKTEEPTKLAVVWTSGDPDVAHRVCLMYTHAANNNKWFDQVNLIVWGPSARLLAGDKNLQANIKKMIEDGVTVQACIVCADSYGVTETLRLLGIEVKGMGKPLTDRLLGNWKVITF